mmetsp:Transcript_2476/g.5168  ORF Transcript_2476/g.5168 Transcript_2476/m.5168 type:complete len:501 (-) Transcript_2476:145-1647(-)
MKLAPQLHATTLCLGVTITLLLLSSCLPHIRSRFDVTTHSQTLGPQSWCKAFWFCGCKSRSFANETLHLSNGLIRCSTSCLFLDDVDGTVLLNAVVGEGLVAFQPLSTKDEHDSFSVTPTQALDVRVHHGGGLSGHHLDFVGAVAVSEFDCHGTTGGASQRRGSDDRLETQDTAFVAADGTIARYGRVVGIGPALTGTAPISCKPQNFVDVEQRKGGERLGELQFGGHGLVDETDANQGRRRSAGGGEDLGILVNQFATFHDNKSRDIATKLLGRQPRRFQGLCCLGCNLTVLICFTRELLQGFVGIQEVEVEVEAAENSGRHDTWFLENLREHLEEGAVDSHAALDHELAQEDIERLLSDGEEAVHVQVGVQCESCIGEKVGVDCSEHLIELLRLFALWRRKDVDNEAGSILFQTNLHVHLALALGVHHRRQQLLKPFWVGRRPGKQLDASASKVVVWTNVGGDQRLVVSRRRADAKGQVVAELLWVSLRSNAHPRTRP